MRIERFEESSSTRLGDSPDVGADVSTALTPGALGLPIARRANGLAVFVLSATLAASGLWGGDCHCRPRRHFAGLR